VEWRGASCPFWVASSSLLLIYWLMLSKLGFSIIVVVFIVISLWIIQPWFVQVGRTCDWVVPVLMSQFNQVSIVVFPFFFVSCLWPSRVVILYFFCYINETRIVLCGLFNKKKYASLPVVYGKLWTPYGVCGTMIFFRRRPCFKHRNFTLISYSESWFTVRI
jgi:hypothetical protein